MNIKPTFSSSLRNFFNENNNIREFLPYVVAKKIAFLLPLPDKAVDSINEYYFDNCDNLVKTLISQINEKFLFNAEIANKISYIIYNTRYELVYNPNSIDFLTMLESAKTGLVPPIMINKLYESKKSISDKSLNMLEIIVNEEMI